MKSEHEAYIQRRDEANKAKAADKLRAMKFLSVTFDLQVYYRYLPLRLLKCIIAENFVNTILRFMNLLHRTKVTVLCGLNSMVRGEAVR